MKRKKAIQSAYGRSKTAKAKATPGAASSRITVRMFGIVQVIACM